MPYSTYAEFIEFNEKIAHRKDCQAWNSVPQHIRYGEKGRGPWECICRGLGLVRRG